MTSTATLFALLPTAEAAGELLTAAAVDPTRLAMRLYPAADDAAHLLGLVRAGRDPRATRWLRGMILAIGLGALLGSGTMAVLAGAADMFGGLLELAVPFGLLVGAFLGGFTAAMAGTESACDEIRALATRHRRGDVLLQVTSADSAALQALRAACTARLLPTQQRG